MASEDWVQMRDYLARHKQEHLLLWLDQLTDNEKAQLYSDLRDLELEKVNKLVAFFVFCVAKGRVKSFVVDVQVLHRVSGCAFDHL